MRIRRAFSLPVIGLSLGLMAGCQQTEQPPAPKPSRTNTSLPLRVTLQTTPSAARQMDPILFTVSVAGAAGHPLSGARVNADLTMPSMTMGRNAFALTPNRPGVYSGTGRFSMAGDWVVTVTVSQGGTKAVQKFPILVR